MRPASDFIYIQLSNSRVINVDKRYAAHNTCILHNIPLWKSMQNVIMNAILVF